MARTTGYSSKYVEEIEKYFGGEPYSTVKKQVVTKVGVQEIEVDEAVDFPTLAGFARKVGVHRETLLEWSKLHPEFGAAYRRAKDFQENYLAVNGLKGLIPPVFAIFTAKNVAGWRDSQPGESPENPIHVKSEKDLTDAELDKRIAEGIDKLTKSKVKSRGAK